MDTLIRQPKVVKSVDIAEKDDYSLSDVERLQKRYQSAAGQQQSVITELFRRLQRLSELERRIAILEGKS